LVFVVGGVGIVAVEAAVLHWCMHAVGGEEGSLHIDMA